jgi:hypothetical protein
MTTYKIISDNTTIGAIGATVTEDDLTGLSVDALIAGGHIELVSIGSKREKKEQE